MSPTRSGTPSRDRRDRPVGCARHRRRSAAGGGLDTDRAIGADRGNDSVRGRLRLPRDARVRRRPRTAVASRRGGRPRPRYGDGRTRLGRRSRVLRAGCPVLRRRRTRCRRRHRSRAVRDDGRRVGRRRNARAVRAFPAAGPRLLGAHRRHGANGRARSEPIRRRPDHPDGRSLHAAGNDRSRMLVGFDLHDRGCGVAHARRAHASPRMVADEPTAVHPGTDPGARLTWRDAMGRCRGRCATTRTCRARASCRAAIPGNRRPDTATACRSTTRSSAGSSGCAGVSRSRRRARSCASARSAA
jgi:hypothetical protein